MKYCDKHNQQYADYLHDCPICVGEEIIKDPDWATSKIWLKPDIVAAVPLKRGSRFARGTDTGAKGQRMPPASPVDGPSQSPMPTLFDSGNKPRFRRRK